jgi:hypothetical protein
MSIRERELKFQAAGDKPKPGLDQLDYCLRLALTYVAAGQRIAGLTPNYRRVRFEALQTNPESTLTDLVAFCHLRPTDAQLRRAAGSIRPPAPEPWTGLSQQELDQLESRRETLRELGYELPFATKSQPR